MERIAILHTGIITAIGNNTGENLLSLMQQRSGISPLPELLPTRLKLPVGEIKSSNATLMSMIQERIAASSEPLAQFSEKLKLPRTALLSILAALEAWQPFGDLPKKYSVGLISANTVGGMDITESLYDSYQKSPETFDFSQFKNHESGIITELTQKALKIDGWNTTISTACSSSANSLMMAARMLHSGKLDLVIGGGADSLSLFTLNGFNSLKILDNQPCRPFDENRRGLNLGEGAAYLVLCRESTAKALGKQPVAFLSGYANANDAYHQTASSPEGKGNRLAIEKALRKAEIRLQDVDYINLHGTGTENNDLSEGRAIQAIAESEQTTVPPASSTKAFTGHTLGAAGAVEAVFSCCSIQEQKIWPQLRFQTQIQEHQFHPETSLKEIPVKHVLSNSFGFGGNCSSLVFSKEENK